MKSTLEFDLLDKEESQAHLRAVKSLDLAMCLWDLRQHFRSKLKYEDLSEHDYNIYEKIQQQFFDILDENQINLEELIS